MFQPTPHQRRRKKRRAKHFAWLLSLSLVISLFSVTPVMASDTGSAAPESTVSTETPAAASDTGSASSGSAASSETPASADSGSASSANTEDPKASVSENKASVSSKNSSTAASDTKKDTAATQAAKQKNAAAPKAAAAAAVTITYRPNRGTFTSGFASKVTASAGSHITLPTSKDISLTGNQASHLAGWSENQNATSPTWEPGADYTVPSKNVTLYAVWQKSMTLAPNLSHMSAYYMIVNQSGTVLSEGKVDGATPITVPGPVTGEVFVEVFVKPEANYLITRLDSGDINNFIYPLGGSYLGRPGSYLKQKDIKRMQNEGYVATFGWGTVYHKEGDTLSVNATAFQPDPEAKITPDKTRNLNEGDKITLTVTLRAGDLLNQYSAALNGTPIVHISTASGNSTVDLPLSNVASSGSDTYTGTVTYTLTAEDIARNKLRAQVEATFNYSYKFPYKGSDNVQHTLDTTAVIDSRSDAVVIDGFSTPHSVIYSYTYIGGVTPPDTFPSCPEDPATYSKGNTVSIAAAPAKGDTVRDDTNGGTWKFLGWFLYDKETSGSVTMGDDNLAFEGRWQFEADPDSLSYDANTGGESYEGTTAPSEGRVGNLVIVSKNAFRRIGYRFLLWNTQADGKGKVYLPDIDRYTLTPGTDILYAQWEKAHHVTYSLSYKGADGIAPASYPAAVKAVPQDTTDYYMNDIVSVSADPAQRTVDDPDNHGTWTFGGWMNVTQAAVEKLTMGIDSIQLTGTWAFTPYDTLTYDGNGADSGKTAGAEAPSGTSVTIEKSGFIRDGYRFTGWNTKKDGSSVAYQAGGSYTLKAGTDDILYAQWEKKPAAHRKSDTPSPTGGSSSSSGGSTPNTGGTSSGGSTPNTGRTSSGGSTVAGTPSTGDISGLNGYILLLLTGSAAVILLPMIRRRRANR